MAAETLRELFVEELRDMYDGEKRLTKALPRMAKAAESDDLRDALETHLEETNAQLERLEQIFDSLDEPVRGKRCHGIEGIVEEGKKAIEELDGGPLLDAAIIAGAQKVEHYEIASYGTLAYFADLLGEKTAKSLLGHTLDEEKAADEKLTTLAKSQVNREALLETGDQQGDEDEEEREERSSRASSSSRNGGRGRRAKRA
jgi:ferritin-like metal-binding protein YciE